MGEQFEINGRTFKIVLQFGGMVEYKLYVKNRAGEWATIGLDYDPTELHKIAAKHAAR